MDQILIINTGGQYCHLIDRRVRQAGVQAKICTPENVPENLGENTRGIIISGGPRSVYEDDAIKCPQHVWSGRVPLLGICYGHQLMAHMLGGRVVAGKNREYGEATLQIIANDTILSGVKDKDIVWMSHGDEVVAPPPAFESLARTKDCSVAAMANLHSGMFGVQFHPEVTHTQSGGRILENFLFKICHCQKTWDARDQLSGIVDEIRGQVGNRNVLFFVSGGVDSTVAFSLCTEAIGPDRVVGVFVDTGFMRKGERRQIEEAFARRRWQNVHFVDASRDFLSAIQGIADPEEKRRRIGDSFLKVQSKVSQELRLLSGRWMLGQGTIYPDTIESGKGAYSALIKTHHNRVPAIAKLIQDGLILEPLAAFYKDEVRQIGLEVGLPEEMVWKHPFPGPGLAVRCLCSEREIAVEPTELLRENALKNTGLRAWSIPLRTVGVQGDYRSYNNVLVLTGDAELDVYGKVTSKLTSEVRGANRVTFLVDSKSNAAMSTAHVRRAYVTEDRLDVLREADALVHDILARAGLEKMVWQFPVVSLPLTFGSGETIALRPVMSTDAMTARFADLPMNVIKEMGRELLKLGGIDAVIYDVTNKPPATIEWE
jgi:GMP synthase (glutamine-hydrolysing)